MARPITFSCWNCHKENEADLDNLRPKDTALTWLDDIRNRIFGRRNLSPEGGGKVYNLACGNCGARNRVEATVKSTAGA